MQYFNKFPRAFYIFGDQEAQGTGKISSELVQDISAYSDVLDRIADNVAFHTFYDIQEGNRPDQCSYDIYGTPIYHWTFFLLNDHLRKQGWPVTNEEIIKRAKIDFPHFTYTTKDSLTNTHKVGETVVGLNTASRGSVLRRNLDIGQVTVAAQSAFAIGEAVSNVSAAITTQTITTTGASLEYLSAHHYENASGEIVDIDPAVGPGALLTEVTHLDRYIKDNDNLKQIKVVKPDLINQVVALFKQAINS